MSEAKVSHSHRTCTEVSSSVLHFLQVGLLLIPIIYRCLLRVSYLVRKPPTTLHILNEDSNITTYLSSRGSSNIDLTVTSNPILRAVEDWEVSNQESCSDHSFIKFAVRQASNRRSKPKAMKSGTLSGEKTLQNSKKTLPHCYMKSTVRQILRERRKIWT